MSALSDTFLDLGLPASDPSYTCISPHRIVTHSESRLGPLSERPGAVLPQVFLSVLM